MFFIILGFVLSYLLGRACIWCLDNIKPKRDAYITVVAVNIAFWIIWISTIIHFS